MYFQRPTRCNRYCGSIGVDLVPGDALADAGGVSVGVVDADDGGVREVLAIDDGVKCPTMAGDRQCYVERILCLRSGMNGLIERNERALVSSDAATRVIDLISMVCGSFSFGCKETLEKNDFGQFTKKTK